MNTLCVIIVEDNENDAELLLRQLKKADFDVDHTVVETADGLREALKRKDWDIVLSDYGMQNFTGLDAIEIVQESGLDIPFIIVSGSIGEEVAASLMRHGVNDYLMKDNLNRLVPAIVRELHEAENRREKREAERALAQSEERMKLALSSAGVGAWEWDLVTDNVFWSPEASAILGIPVAGSKYSVVRDMVLAEDIERVEEAYTLAVERKSAFDIRIRIKRRDDEIVWAAVSGKGEYSESGKPLRIVGTIRDITRDKRAEDALIDAEERYRVMAESASDAVITIDETSRILFANPAAETVFGYDRSELVGEHISILQPEGLRQAHLKGIERFLATGEKRVDWNNLETSAIRKDGRSIIIQISFGSYTVQGRKMFTAFIRDVTERKRIETAVQESEKSFRALVEATTQYVWQMDAEGNVAEDVSWWNKLTGQEDEESQGAGWLERVHPADSERVKQQWEHGLRTGEPMMFESRVIAHDGKINYYRLNGVPIYNSDGERRWLCTLADITAKRVAEDRYRTVSSMLTDYMFEVEHRPDGSTDLVWVTGSFERITGYDLKTFLEIGGWRAIVHPDDQNIEEEHFDILRTNKSIDSELRLVRKTGETAWVRIYAQPIWDTQNDRLSGVRGAVQDITVKKSAELAVLESEARLRTILDTEPECVKILGKKGEIVDVNPAGLAVLGLDSLDKAIGLTAKDVIIAEDVAGFENVVAEVLTGKPATYTFEVKAFDGVRRVLEMHAVPLRSSDGEITSVLGVSRDVTVQRATEDSLYKARKQYEDLINSIEGIVWEVDIETFTFTFVSKQAEAILGYPVEEWLKPDFWIQHIHEEDRDRALRICRDAIEQGEGHTFEYRMIAADGRAVWIRDIVTIVYEGGEPALLRGVMFDATEQRSKDAAIQQQAMLIEQAYEAIFVWEVDEGIIEWNQGCERLYGHKREDVIGRLSYELLQTKFPIPRENFLQELLRTKYWSGEVRHTTKDGRTVYADAKYQLIEYDGRRVVLQTTRDVTDSRRAEIALRRSEARYRHLFDNNPYPMWVYDTETLEFLAVNDAAVYRYGYTEAEFLSMSITDIRPEEDIPAALEKARTTTSRIDVGGHWRHKLKDGTVIYVEVTSHALEFEGRKARLVLANDISDRLRAEEAVQRSEAKYRELFENANDVIYTHDLNGRFTSLNRAAERIMGYSEEEALKLNLTEVVAPEFLERAKTMIQRKVEGSPATIYETEVIAKDGRRVPLEINTRLIYEEGKPVGVQGIGRDISERLAAEQALRASEEQLRQSQKLESIGILAGGMAHDFNNMLTAINGYSDLVLRKLGPDDPIRRHIEEIRKAGERSAELTRQLLAFSRRQILQPVTLDVNETVAETTSMLERLIGEDIKVNLRLSADLWKVQADPGQLAQVLINLAVNARDAMPRGGSLTIETSNVELDGDYASRHIDVRPGRYVMLGVSDTGTGMDEATRKRVFDPFFTTKPTGRGTGLGLSTVYGIVKQSGGNIWVYSEPGKGSTFKIYLPEAGNDLHASQPEIARPETPTGTETILLVEDEDAVRGLAREILESCGYTVIDAANGRDALLKVNGKCTDIDLLVTDIVMPEMGGRELSEKIAETCPEIKVLFTSGYTDDAILRHGIIDEGTNFLQKPFTFDGLSRKVRSLLDQ